MKKLAGRLFILTGVLLFLGVIFRIPHIWQVAQAYSGATQGARISYTGYFLMYLGLLAASVWVFRLGWVLLRRG